MVLLWTETQRGVQKGSRELALKFSPGIKIKPEQKLCFQSLVVKRKDVLRVWKKLPASAETMLEYWFHKTGTKKTISVLQISQF